MGNTTITIRKRWYNKIRYNNHIRNTKRNVLNKQISRKPMLTTNRANGHWIVESAFLLGRGTGGTNDRQNNEDSLLDIIACRVVWYNQIIYIILIHFASLILLLHFATFTVLPWFELVWSVLGTVAEILLLLCPDMLMSFKSWMCNWSKALTSRDAFAFCKSTQFMPAKR